MYSLKKNIENDDTKSHLGALEFDLKLIFLVVRGGVRVRSVVFSIDNIVTLDVAVLARERNAPVGLGVVTATGLSLDVIVVVVIHDSPVNVVVRDVGVIDGLLGVVLAVNIGGGNSEEGEENNGDLLK